MAIVTSSLAAACLTKLIHSVSFSTGCPSPRLRICFHVFPLPIGSMYGIYIYANIRGILMVNVTIYNAYMDPMGIGLAICHQ